MAISSPSEVARPQTERRAVCAAQHGRRLTNRCSLPEVPSLRTHSQFQSRACQLNSSVRPRRREGLDPLPILPASSRNIRGPLPRGTAIVVFVIVLVVAALAKWCYVGL